MLFLPREVEFLEGVKSKDLFFIYRRRVCEMGCGTERSSGEQADAAIEFGVELSDGKTDTKLYILAFLQTLLHQRQKLDLGLLANYLKPTIVKAWNEVLSILEARKRKVLNIQSGSLIFTLFCPTQESSRQLQDDTWIKTAIQKLQELIRTLGKRMNT